jgi:hypothetical protein
MAAFVAADVILGATTIRQITQSDHQSNQEIRKAMTSGGNTVSRVSGKSSGEISTFTSGDLAALLALGTNTFISAGLSLLTSTITVPFKARAPGGSYASGSTHPAITGANALIVPTAIEASQDGDAATCACDIHWLSTDGQTQGATDTATNALAAQGFNAEYALGPVYINGSSLTGAQSVRITPGIEVVKPPLGSGSIYPTQASLKEIVPTIEITFNDYDAFVTEVGDFTAMTSAVVYLRLRADAGLYGALASVNISFTFAAGLADTNAVSVSSNDDGSGTVTLHGKTVTTSVAATIP